MSPPVESPAAAPPLADERDGPRPAPAASPVVSVSEVRAGMWSTLHEGARELPLVPRLGSRVIVKRLRGTKLGRMWLVLRPLMDTVGKALIFGGVLQVATPGPAPYFLFLLAGLISWRVFDRTVYLATRSFDYYRKVMRDIDFPLILAPLAAAAYPAVEVSMYVVIFAGALGIFWFLDGNLYLNTTPEFLLVVPGLLLSLVIAFGVSFWTSVLHGKARDTRFVVRYVLEFWLYLTPVIYPLSALPGAYEWLAAINPMTAPVEMTKAGLLGTGDVRLPALVWSLCFAAIITLSGLWFFSREAARSVDLHGATMDDDEDEE